MSWEVELANAVSRFLTVELPAKKGTLPLWVYAFGGLLVLGSWIAARSLKSRRGALLKEQVERLEMIPLVAIIFSGDSAAAQRSVAKLEKSDGQYVLDIRHTQGAVVTEDRQQLATLAAVESYLEKKTLFRLSDFKPSTK